MRDKGHKDDTSLFFCFSFSSSFFYMPFFPTLMSVLSLPFRLFQFLLIVFATSSFSSSTLYGTVSSPRSRRPPLPSLSPCPSLISSFTSFPYSLLHCSVIPCCPLYALPQLFFSSPSQPFLHASPPWPALLPPSLQLLPYSLSFYLLLLSLCFPLSHSFTSSPHPPPSSPPWFTLLSPFLPLLPPSPSFYLSAPLFMIYSNHSSPSPHPSPSPSQPPSPLWLVLLSPTLHLLPSSPSSYPPTPLFMLYSCSTLTN